MFILVEDQFGVGDIVDLDGQTAGVVDAGLAAHHAPARRSTARCGTCPNGEIRRVGNKSQHWSRALIDIEVAYDTDLDHAEAVIAKVAEEVAQGDGEVIEKPEVWGVEQLGANGIVIRLVVKTRPSEQFRVSRELRRRIKAAFDEEGIEIPFPQQTVWHRSTPVAQANGDQN